jgi:hypothetical protein
MKIMIEHYGVKITIEDAEDIDMHRLFEHLKAVTIGAGWLESTFNDAVIEYYEQYKLNQHEL